MENKDLDGQLNLDTDAENAPKENEAASPIHTVEFEIGKPAEKESFIFEISHNDEKKDSIESAEPISEELVIGTAPVAQKRL